MDLIDFLDAFETDSNSDISSNDHGQDFLDKMMGLEDCNFKKKFRMIKSTFDLLFGEVLVFYLFFK